MSLLSVDGLLLDGVFQSFNLSEVLSLLQLDAVTFKVGLFDPAFAFGGEILDGLFSLLEETHLLLLVFKQGD
jgi:hypothetical protein